MMEGEIRFRDIYEAHAPAVYRCLLAWSRNHAVAEDLTAETFVRAIASGQDIREESARAYLVVIARNLWREQIRKGRRQAALNGIATPLIHLDPTVPLTLQTVLQAIDDLPEQLREPLVLFAQGGLSYEEIAAHLRLPLATIKIRIFRARQRLEKYR